MFDCSECLIVLFPRILSLSRATWCSDRSLPMERRRTRVSSVWICERVVFVSSFVSRVLLFQVQCRRCYVFSRPRLPPPLRRVRTVGGEPRCTVTSTPRTMHGMDPHRPRGCLWNVEGGSDQPVPLSRLSLAQGSLPCFLFSLCLSHAGSPTRVVPSHLLRFEQDVPPRRRRPTQTGSMKHPRGSPHGGGEKEKTRDFHTQRYKTRKERKGRKEGSVHIIDTAHTTETCTRVARGKPTPR